MDSRHVCKFCKKSFPCGRSLGGHIRSHLIHNSSNSGNASNAEPKSGSGPGYELRENPKKTNKADDLGLMSSSPSSWSTKSETKDGSDPNPGRKSGLVGGNNSNSSVSEVVEPEQEEVAVAMSLIMLSRDGRKGEDTSPDNLNGGKKKREKIPGKGSVIAVDLKKSENLEVLSSGYLQNGSKVKEFEVSANGFASNDEKNKPYNSKNSVSSATDSSCKKKEKIEFAASGYLQNGSKLKEFQVSKNGLVSNDQITKPPKRKRKITDPNNMSKKLGSATSGQVKNGSKPKESEVSENGSASNDQKNNNPELGSHEVAENSELVSDNNDKRSKFECTTCNKVFYSYQALGGHRASHKKLLGIKPSPETKLESGDGDFLSPPPHDHHDQHKLGQIGIGSSSSTSVSMKVAQKHECPMCFRVFPSGQALGGHKRSHLIAANSASTNTNTNDINKDCNVIEKSSSSEMREFLDLNLPPAAVEEEASIPTSSSSNNLINE
ncbi:hypothetical protein Cgig2_006088 [Carnegiea gigantea]|uniref:C2H2-type domain-containing protein n=1 Tax=Carnegiea gigantea TaxID=171969 RepID=A0A9Q1L0K0_9CARY|nr:hypothetical protein Cgig2_006088 [Carnegiea gigantea]